MSDIIERISALGIMPVITNIDSIEDCDSLAAALTAGGIPAMEITFRMKNAEVYIRRVREAHLSVAVGAGTVITLEQAEKAIGAGAQFVVAPGLNPEIVKYCQSRGVEMIPGVSTPSEVETALGLGLKNVKFFPAEQSGGVAAIKSICGPYKNVGFMPTGGLNLDNIAEYFAFDRIIACGGTFMLGSSLAKKDWAQITELCRISVRTMLGLKLAHVGINADGEADAQSTASALASLLRLELGKDGANSVFVDTFAEIMKHGGPGRCGHIGFSTPNLDRAVRYFRAMGAEFDEASAKTDEKGRLKVIYFRGEIAGFAVHLVRA